MKNIPQSWRTMQTVTLMGHGTLALSTGAPSEEAYDNGMLAIFAPELYHALKAVCTSRGNHPDRGVAIAKASSLLKEIDKEPYSADLSLKITDDQMEMLIAHAENGRTSVQAILQRAVNDEMKRISRHNKRTGLNQHSTGDEGDVTTAPL